MLLEFKGGQWLKATNENHIIGSSTPEGHQGSRSYTGHGRNSCAHGIYFTSRNRIKPLGLILPHPSSIWNLLKLRAMDLGCIEDVKPFFAWPKVHIQPP